MDKLKAIIVDDEKHASETLMWELERNCPQVDVIAVFNHPEAAAKEIPSLDTDILFLDVEMPKMSGFDLLQALNAQGEFGVIFTTAYDQFALKAIKHSAVDYLLKPIDKSELQSAVAKYSSGKRRELSQKQLALLFDKVNSRPGDMGKVALPSAHGLVFVDPEEIVFCQSDSNYTVVHFKSGKKHVISKTLKEIEALMDGHGFMRVHHSYLVNLRHVTEYVKSDGGYLVLDEGSHISVSRSRKEDLMNLFA
jgi:two-component system LytT family response regulator